jgi:hypothetical protein
MDTTEKMLLAPRVLWEPPVIGDDRLLILHGMLLHFPLRDSRGVRVHNLLVRNHWTCVEERERGGGPGQGKGEGGGGGGREREREREIQ